ncbi:Restriction modification system DNA specificity domain protein [Desulfosarcina cetonica]|uniref:restriction endonuclease subunit S n=1 Tax=Desulfosarcina cetonica TaxID=90730 RepID=UPI0006CF8857|nr:restriction endonuclease subunit S [Desulfosarcina cetonica]VTR64422.1 Restriction modification system DNA specificity domain protein [Desulfosarcina cetonica]
MVTLPEMPRYGEFKETGHEWLDNIPTNWEHTRLKFFSSLKARIGFHGLNSSDFIDEGAFCITGTDFKDGCIDYSNCYYVSDKWYELDKNIQVRNGDVLITKDGTIGKTAVVKGLKGKATLNSGVFLLRPKIYSQYLYWILNSRVFGEQVDYISRGSTINHLYERDFKNFYFPIPNNIEQIAIANFLDKRVALIHDAISIKERQISLLQERRQIIIQNAVTKGLNPDVQMKDSGVDWIGQIPKHWELFANRALFSERVESGKEGLPLLSVSIHSGVSSEELTEEENTHGRVKIEDKTKYILVKKGDIAFNMMRAWQGGIGAVSTDGMVSPAYIVAKPKSTISAEYFEHQYRCPEFIQQMDRFSKGITDFRKRLYWDGFKQLNTVVPPINEQLEIVLFIKTHSEKVDSGIDLLNNQIEKLKEYKTTLINSAVTGKIKVA